MSPMSYRPFTSSTAEMPTTVTGPGFTLRAPEPADATALGELVGDTERAEGVVQGWADRWTDDGYGTWVVEGEQGELLGFIGVRPRTDDITLTVRSDETAAGDGRARRALRLAVAHAIEWYPDLPLRMRVPAEDVTTRAVAESSGLVHVPEDDHEARGREWKVFESPYVRTFTSFPAKARESVTDLWVRVNEAGGAVGFLPDATRADVEEEMERRSESLQAGRLTGVALMAPTGQLLGVAFLGRAVTSLMDHVRNVEVVMVDPESRGLSFGRHLMAGVHRVGREAGVEILTLDYRDGLGLGDFYAQSGYEEVGRHAGLVRVADGDDRDSVLMMRRLD